MKLCKCGCGQQVFRADGRCRDSRLQNRRVRERVRYLRIKSGEVLPERGRPQAGVDPLAANYSPEERKAISARIKVARAVVAEAKRYRHLSILPGWLPL